MLVQLQFLLPGRGDMKPSNPIVTVMFVDIAGFSISAERMPADQVFERLRSLLSELAAIVQKHGGIIDKTIGDGFLCFFGCGYDGIATSERHADQAIRCACELQRFAADRAIRAAGTDEPVYPLRIGLNTAPVFIGNMGSAERPEWTLIGHGVNVAQRLEFACESFRVMVSLETLGAWTEFAGGAVRVHKRQVQMKHRETMFEAFEIDPFESDPERLKSAVAVYRDRVGLKRKEPRLGIDGGVALAVHPERVEAVLVNYSRSGLAVRTPNYFSRGTRLSLNLEAMSKRLAALCRKHEVAPLLSAEVRWGIPMGDDYLHGLELSGLSAEELDALFAAFQEYLSVSAVAA
jgi:class 3 adenylate cyclase